MSPLVSFRRSSGRIALAALALLGSATMSMQVQSAAADVKLPQYELDTSWPKLPLPNKWALGLINGIYIDKNNHVWVYHTPEDLNRRLTGAAANPPTSKCCVPAPAIIEFSEKGEVLRAWGDPTKPGDGFEWPTAGHGISIDYKGNVWIGGSATRASQDGSKQADGLVLKFSPDGKLLLQIGGKGASEGSNDPTLLSGASAVDVDPATNEAFISDGYGNKRVIVFDADTGAFKRQWGAYGNKPSDERVPRYNGTGEIPKQFNLVHGIRLSDDGFVYVCDRLNNRVQVFRHDGTFVWEKFYEPTTGGSGSVGNISLWPSAKQEIMVLNDPGNFEWALLRRADGKELARFGHYGTYAGEFTSNHQMEFDRKGNIYTSEDFRVQKFKIVNGVKP
jgi:hypothetical protein